MVATEVSVGAIPSVAARTVTFLLLPVVDNSFWVVAAGNDALLARLAQWFNDVEECERSEAG